MALHADRVSEKMSRLFSVSFKLHSQKVKRKKKSRKSQGKESQVTQSEVIKPVEVEIMIELKSLLASLDLLLQLSSQKDMSVSHSHLDCWSVHSEKKKRGKKDISWLRLRSHELGAMISNHSLFGLRSPSPPFLVCFGE